MRLANLLTLALVGVTAAARLGTAQSEQPKVDPELVEETVKALELSFESGDAEDRVAALTRAVEVPDPSVVAQVVPGLADPNLQVLDAALLTLRHMDHAAALAALHKTLQRDKRFRDDPELTPKLLRAIGEHADPKSISILTKNLFRGDPKKNREITGARILAVANIRSKQSVEELIALMNKASQKNVYPHMGELRLALLVLTGVDRGKSREAWQSWWNDNKKELVVAAKMRPLPEKDQRSWDRFWGREYKYERRTKRGDRGQD